ncbi:MAG: aldose epimerase, partial [Chloroflexi bacterium]
TPEANLSNASLCASYILAPWSNRIRDARFVYQGQTYTLKSNFADGTAIHGVVKDYAWDIIEASETRIRLQFSTADKEGVNFPFPFSVEARYELSGAEFIWYLRITNEGDSPMPAGFGHHPYFLRAPGGGQNAAQLEVPCDGQFVLVNQLPEGAPVSITPELDFRMMRGLPSDRLIDDLLTWRQGEKPAKILYPAWDLQLAMYADPIFNHFVLYSPPERPYFALEPVTNANDGFNLYAQGVEGTGVFELAPQESREGTVRLIVQQAE